MCWTVIQVDLYTSVIRACLPSFLPHHQNLLSSFSPHCILPHNGFDYDISKEIDFCESCVSGKIHRCPFPRNGRERAEEPLGLIHSDVCGKISSPSLSRAEYFVVFIDDKTHYVWVYVIKHKDEVFQKFMEWKSLVENSSGHKVKKLRTDNGGEYTSTEFESYLKDEGIEHQYSIPKTPEQNEVSERMNRTLVETVRSMLADSRLPQRFFGLKRYQLQHT